jgi:hypothetical protein
VYKTELISPAQAEKLVWEKKGEQTKLSDKQIERMQKEYVTSTPGKLKIVPESDPAPAIVTDASSMFFAVNTEAVKAELAASTAKMDAIIANIPDSAPEPAAVPIPDWLAVPAWLQ